MTESNMTVETGFSLADLAALNTDDIQTLTSRVPAAGIYVVQGESVVGKMAQQEGKDPLARFNFSAVVLEAQPISKDVDPQNLVNRKLTESYTLWPQDIQELIGLLKGRYQKVGLPNTGNMGGVEGQPPGWVDGFVGHIFRIKVSTYNDKAGETRARYDWLPPEETAAA